MRGEGGGGAFGGGVLHTQKEAGDGRKKLRFLFYSFILKVTTMFVTLHQPISDRLALCRERRREKQRERERERERNRERERERERERGRGSSLLAKASWPVQLLLTPVDLKVYEQSVALQPISCYVNMWRKLRSTVFLPDHIYESNQSLY